MITPDGELLACESLTSGWRRVLPMHMFLLRPLPDHCLATGTRTSFLGIFSTQHTVCRLLHVTRINHHFSSFCHPPHASTGLQSPIAAVRSVVVEGPCARMYRGAYVLCLVR